MVKERKTEKGEKAWYIYFYPFGNKDKIGIKLPTIKGKKEAERIEMMILTACRSGDYSGLDDVSREACIRMFKNRKLEIPVSLGGDDPKKEFTFHDASKLFLSDPGVHDSPGRWRHELSLANLGEKIGTDTPIRSIWIPELRQYQNDRLKDKITPSTINRELVTLSKLFSVLVEHRIVDVNPVRNLKRLSEREGERQVYLSLQDVLRIASRCPDWYQPMVMTAYYTGMRRGELLALSRKQVDLSKRIIVFSPLGTKEAHWKRIPIHMDLMPIIAPRVKVAILGTDRVFPFRDKKGARPVDAETFKNVWPRACEALEKEQLLEKPFPRFHDLRHTWRTNARRSGIDPQIAEAILGHQARARSVSDRYGRISDQELVKAIDQMTFDHGDTEILVARDVASEDSEKNSNWIVTGKGSKRKSGCTPL